MLANPRLNSLLKCLLPALALVGCGGNALPEAGEDGASLEMEVRQSKQTNACRGDRSVDQAATLIEAVAESPMRIRLRASPGSDSSGKANVLRYELTSSTGELLSITPTVYDNCSAGDNPNFIRAEPIKPGTTYQVRAVTSDACGNLATSAPLQVTTPALFNDVTGPTVTLPAYIRLSGIFGIYMAGAKVFASDDTAVERVEFFAEGNSLGVVSGAQIHTWSTEGGDYFFKGLGFGLAAGTTVQVTAVAYDFAGNSTTVSGPVTVP